MPCCLVLREAGSSKSCAVLLKSFSRARKHEAHRGAPASFKRAPQILENQIAEHCKECLGRSSARVLRFFEGRLWQTPGLSSFSMSHRRNSIFARRCFLLEVGPPFFSVCSANNCGWTKTKRMYRAKRMLLMYGSLWLECFPRV